ncbi:PucR family transcriptional regulator [Streptomyces sp. NPDC004610]|uniref:PucR family transcriptional regulator n=1 Tax=unclassified Streptomyces TaxID=2593676 RepID=UPI0033AF8016
MRDLIGRLEVVDDTAAGALRVIDHFDSLVEQRAPLAAVVRATAALAGCPAGFHDASRALTRRYDASGRQLTGDDGRSWPQAPVPFRPGSAVWLERPGPPRPLDALLLERAARALHALAAPVPPSSAEAVRIVCDPEAPESDRRDAAARLGLTGTGTVTVAVAVAVAAVAPDDATGGPAGLTALVGRHTVSLFPGIPALPATLRAGTATAVDPSRLPEAAERARLALRLTDRPDGPGPSLVAHDDLGALTALAERITPPEAAEVEDVRRLDGLLTTRPWVVDTLQAVLDQPSLRRAANILHIHHSTLQERLTWLTPRLGYAVTHSGGRQRATAAVLLWRLAHSEDQHHSGSR